MANGLPSNIYSGGAVLFNSQPATQFYLQSVARKRAQEDALDNYFMNFNKSVTPSGMRTQDIEGGWMQKVNDWRNFYTNNKDLIEHPNKDNGKAYNEYMGRYQDIINDSQKSVNATKNAQSLLPIFSDPNRRTRLPQTTLSAVHANDLSIYDPNHKPLDVTSLDFSNKPFDIAAQQKYIKGSYAGLEKGDLVKNIAVDPKTHSMTVTYNSTYSPDALAALYMRSNSAYKSDPSFEEFIDNMSNDPQQVQDLNGKFKAAYGRDIQSNNDIAAAYTLNSIQTEKDKQKVSGYNPFLGMGIENTLQKQQREDFNFGVSMTNALRTNDENTVNDLRHILRGGNGKIKFYDSFVRNQDGIPFLYIQTLDENGDTQTQKLAIDDPSLPDYLTNLYQNVMGSDVSQEKQQYPTSKTNVVVPPTRTAPKQKSSSTYKKGSLD